jgi:hypothetical protein
MKKIDIFLIIVLLGLSLIGCKKSSSDNPTVDLAANASGTYTGQNQIGNMYPMTVVITKESITTVVMAATLNGTLFGTYAGITVTTGDNGKILLSYNAGNTGISGTVDGKSLVYYFNTVKFFIGTKP